MGHKLVVGPVTKGLRQDREPFYIDNDSFPTLVNAYAWRGKGKRKRGTSLINRLNRWIGLTDGSGNITVTIAPTPIQSGISTFVIGTDVFTDPGGSSPVTLITNSSGSGTLNRTTGVLTITGSKPSTAVYYFPGLPAMGLRPFVIASNPPPISIAFDTDYSYQIGNTYNASGGISIWDISFYKNPASGTYTNYVAKTANTPLTWNGQNYQQFWVTNFQGGMFATNGVPGMQFAPASSISSVSVTTGTPPTVPSTLTCTIAGNVLVVGDFVFLNEWIASGGGNADTLNFQSGYVTSVAGNVVTITLPNATVTAGTYTPGIIQYLTNRSTPTVDGIRWYDGDPTNGGVYPPAGNSGWVNYNPPLSYGSNWSIDNCPAGQYYLAGATIIYPFRDFLLFVGPWIQTSTSSPFWLQDTIIFAQNGTPFYTCSFTQPVGGPNYGPTTQYFPILVPQANSPASLGHNTATASALWEDITGFGGYISSGVSQPITTLVPNEDVLILGYAKAFTRLIYTGNNLIPFLFYRINTELGSSSTFSAITFDKGSFSLGSFGFVMTTQVASQRIDLQIPELAFQVNHANNGAQRVCAGRNYYDEWVYFTYCDNQNTSVFPNQTLMYNYRDDSWSILDETYTCYGEFILKGGLTWEAFTGTWGSANIPWNSSQATIGNPNLIAGNQQGFICIRDVGTGEAPSLYVQNINTSTGIVTSPNHELNFSDPDTGAYDYVVFQNVLGTVLDENGDNINGNCYQVQVIDANTFLTYPKIKSGTYHGGGTMTRAYVPFIQSKQFPLSWDTGRKTIIGPQQYLFTETANSQITLNLYLSTDSSTAHNNPQTNDGIIYSQILYTCQESSNLGLQPVNTNLLQINQIDSYGKSSNAQSKIWHRMNTSLLGDTVQFGFTLSPEQMLAPLNPAEFTITGATQANPCVLTCSSDFVPGDVITISGVMGMYQLNGNYYTVTAVTPTTVTINVSSINFSSYISGGTAQLSVQGNQFAEIEFHGCVLDVKPSAYLA